MNRLYMENATVSWDGNPVTRKEAIQKFLEDLPETNHTLTALDAQPVSCKFGSESYHLESYQL